MQRSRFFYGAAGLWGLFALSAPTVRAATFTWKPAPIEPIWSVPSNCGNAPARDIAAGTTFATPQFISSPVSGPVPAGVNSAGPYYPTQIEQAYGLAALQGGTGTAAIVNGGAGQTVAIIDAYHYNNALSALNTFCAGYGGAWTLPTMSALGPGPTFTQLNQNGGAMVTTGSDSGWNSEEALDIEYVHAAAPKASIILYEANSNNDSDLYAAVQAAANNPAVSVVTMSWGENETSGETAYDSYFTTPGTKGKNGVTFCASTGDWGDINEGPGNGISGYPAASPKVVAVGGTSLYLTTNYSYSYETAWGWNVSLGAGGGTSSIEPKPWWQTSYGTTHPGNILATTTSRAIPDVSMDADTNTGVYIYDPANGGWFVAGGTSLASPMFAGLVADADGIRAANGITSLDGPSQTLPALYSLSGDFNDITAGNISPTGNPTYSATTGYDLATGLGSPIANQFVPDLAFYGISRWASAVSGSWSSVSNWTGGVPNLIGASALINVPTAAQLTVTLDEPVTLGSLVLGNSLNPAAGYTLSGAGGNTLTFNNSGSGAAITLTDGSHQINVPVVLNDNLLVSGAGTNSWTLSFGSAGSVTDNGDGFSLTMSGSLGTLNLSGNVSLSGTLTVAGGTLNQNGGNVQPAMEVVDGGAYNLTGGSLSPTGGFAYVGYSGVGSLTQTSGVHSISGQLNLGYLPGGNGTYSLSGSGMAVAASLTIGGSGYGSFVQSGGSNSLGAMYLATSPAGSGTYNLSGGLLTAGNEWIGYNGFSNFAQSGGTNTVSTIALAQNAGSTGIYSLTDGLLTANQILVGAGNGVLNFSGGTIGVGGPASITVPIVLNNPFGTGTVNFAGSSSSLTISGPISGPGGLAIVGSGMLVLSGNDSFTGTIEASSGTVQFDGASAVLGEGSIRASSGAVVQYSNALIQGGFLRGPGIHTTLPGTSSYFSGVQTFASTLFLQNGSDTFTNFTNGGQVTNNGPLVWDGGENNIGGSLTVNSAISSDDFINAGVITINTGGAINNHLSDINSGGGGRITVSSGGTLNANSQGEGTALNLQDSLLINNGALVGTTNIYYGATVQGSGTFGLVNIYEGGTLLISPSNSPVVPAAVLSGGSVSGAGSSAMAVTTDGAYLVAPNETDRLTLSGDLSGSGSITKLGAGTVILSGTNTYEGGTIVLEGTLVAMNSEALADGANLTVGNALAFGTVQQDSAAAAGLGLNEATPVPEPGTLVLLAAAGSGLLGRRRKQHARR